MNPIILMLLIIISSKNAANGQDILKLCGLNSTYNPLVDTGYAANLNSLLSSLSSNASAGNNAASNNYGFYNSTAGVGGRDVVYGLYQCRGDVDQTDCQACVQTASQEILTECPNDKAGLVWYDNCLLRYSNRTDFNDNRIVIARNMQSSPDPVGFNEYLGNMLNDLATQASNDISGKKFAVQEGNFSAFVRIFSLAQCISDLSTTNCDTCLRGAITQLPNCCNASLGVRLLFPDCNLRYETSRFYNVAPPPPPPPPSVNNFPVPPTSNATLPLPDIGGKKRIPVGVIISIIVSIVVAIMLVVVALVCRRMRSKKRISSTGLDEEQIPTVESLNYSLLQVQNATNNFSEDSKIGQGGFGPVYKGTLPNGQEVAVKRLSQSSLQGLEEFKNEIVLLAGLQHRNLVRLLGFCFENQEMILIYEFFRNKSLDRFLFDLEKQPLLDWSTRYKIIGGIARGLLYLHEDSRLKIIHRDLKAGNVLLDENMNAKIADFGTARLFQVDQSEENTILIAGTRGYMAPEYAIYGQISVKSDVFSFGVLLLEIISGKKNSTFYQSDGVDDLLSYAWKSFRNGTPLDLLDPSVGELYARIDVTHCIHVGLLCVQEDAEFRPTMSSVVIMLSSNSVTLPIPRQPAFSAMSRIRSGNTKQPEQFDTSTNKSASDTSTNKSALHSGSGRDASFTELYPR